MSVASNRHIVNVPILDDPAVMVVSRRLSDCIVGDAQRNTVVLLRQATRNYYRRRVVEEIYSLRLCKVLVSLSGNQVPDLMKQPNEHPESGLSGVDPASLPYQPDSVTIIGVVAEGSKGCWGHDDYKVRHFRFDHWRKEGGSLVKKRLLVLERVSIEGLQTDDGERDEEWWDAFWSKYPDLSIQRLTVRISEDETRSVLIELHPLEASDQEFDPIIEQLQKPVTLGDKIFGTLTLDRRRGQFVGTAKWNRRKVKVSFDTNKKGSAKVAIASGKALWEDQKSWKTRIEDFAVEQLLPMKNDNWLDEDEAALSAKQFKKCMTLESISIRVDGSFDFGYDDGELFWGHPIGVSGNHKDGLIHADFSG